MYVLHLSGPQVRAQLHSKLRGLFGRVRVISRRCDVNLCARCILQPGKPGQLIFTAGLDTLTAALVLLLTQFPSLTQWARPTPCMTMNITATMTSRMISLRTTSSSSSSNTLGVTPPPERANVTETIAIIITMTGSAASKTQTPLRFGILPLQ